MVLFSWDKLGIQRNLVFMWIIGGVSFFVLFIYELDFISICWKNSRFDIKTHSDCNCYISPIDSDVAEERSYVAELKKTDLESHNLVVRNVSKTYGNLLAVNQMSFKVDQ